MSDRPLMGTASCLHRTLECPVSQLLPHTAEVSEKAKAAGVRGTELHRYYELEGENQAWKELPDEYKTEAKAMQNQYFASKARGALKEIKYKFDCKTGAVTTLLAEGHRNYGTVEDWEITGTADVCVAGHYTVECWDLKTGRDNRKYKDPKELESNEQLLFGALCTWRRFAPHARYFHLGIQHWPLRKRDFKTQPEDYHCIVDRAVLWEFEDRLRRSWEHAKQVKEAFEKREQIKAKVGEWCRFCPAQPSCPEFAKQRRAR